MADYLVFSLVAPMGSFGGLAGHEHRSSGHWPGRSAILGLIGAALGVRRSDKAGQTALSTWKTSVSVFSYGSTWKDFHTVQAVPSSRIKRPATRRDALSALQRSDTTIITRREYMSDCVFGIALRGGDINPLKNALKYPAFIPYLGRKSCPLSAPMNPKSITAGSPLDALENVNLPDFLKDIINPKHPILIASDEPFELHEKVTRESRWDEPIDRELWHFGQRHVHIFRPEVQE